MTALSMKVESNLAFISPQLVVTDRVYRRQAELKKILGSKYDLCP